MYCVLRQRLLINLVVEINNPKIPDAIFVTVHRVLNAVSKSVLGSRIGERFTTMCVPPLWLFL